MAKKFKFKLEGLLKVREFKEKKIKLELGEILKEIETTKSRIAKDELDIEQAYDAQEKFLSEPSSGQMAQFFPQFINTKKEDIKAQENILGALNRSYDAKVQELAQAKGEVKILDNLKDKHATAHRKEMDKKLQESIDELTMAKKHKERML